MRRTTILTLAGLALATGLRAQGGPGGGGRMALDDANFAPTLPMLTTMLTLTPEQVARITPLRDTMLLESKEHRDKAAGLRAAMMAARQGGAPADSVARLQQALRGAMMALMPYRLAFHARVRPLLTPEQQAVMDRRQQEQMQRMHGGG